MQHKKRIYSLINLFLKITLPAVILFLCNTLSYSQTKVGYIDTKKIIDNMQEARDAKLKLDNLVNQWQKELNDLQDSLKKFKDDFEKKKLILTEQMKQDKEKEITDLESSIDDFKLRKFGENGEYSQKQIDFMKPVQDRIFKAIETVAKDDDYDFIIDRSGDILLLYVNEKYDITSKVQKIIEGK